MVAERNEIFVWGLNHRSAGMELREQLSGENGTADKVVSKALVQSGVEEAVLLRTCNRVEVIGSSSSNVKPGERVCKTLESCFEKMGGLGEGALSSSRYYLEGQDAVRHVFAVTSGLDSLVVGEPQIAGQVKEAYSRAKEIGLTSSTINRLFERALGAAKKVRTQTNIGRKAVSIPYAAKELAQHIFGDLSEASVLLLGAGEIGELTVKHLHRCGVKRIYVANRTLSRVQEWVSSYGAIPLRLKDRNEFLSEVDIVISACTMPKAGDWLVLKEEVENALLARNSDVQFYIDLACPRNIEPQVGELEDAFLYCIDDLEEVVKRNLATRGLETERAQELLDHEVAEFIGWQSRRSVEPIVRGVLDNCRLAKQVELDKTMRRLKRVGFGDEDCQKLVVALDKFGDSLLAKVLHNPLETLRKADGQEQYVAEAFETLFSRDNSKDK